MDLEARGDPVELAVSGATVEAVPEVAKPERAAVVEPLVAVEQPVLEVAEASKAAAELPVPGAAGVQLVVEAQQAVAELPVVAEQEQQVVMA